MVGPKLGMSMENIFYLIIYTCRTDLMALARFLVGLILFYTPGLINDQSVVTVGPTGPFLNPLSQQADVVACLRTAWAPHFFPAV